MHIRIYYTHYTTSMYTVNATTACFIVFVDLHCPTSYEINSCTPLILVRNCLRHCHSLRHHGLSASNGR